MLGLNPLFHVFSLVLFVGAVSCILRQSKRLRLIQDIWFTEDKRLLISPREFMSVFSLCYGLDTDSVKSLTSNMSTKKKILKTAKVRSVFQPNAWRIVGNRLSYSQRSKLSDQSHIHSGIEALSQFLDLSIDIISPS